MNSKKASVHKVPVYEVRLVQSRRPLRLAETTLSDATTSAHALHALIGLTDREHFAALFVNGHHHVTGAHIVAVGAQHGIPSLDVRVLFRAAICACSSALVIGHYVPRNIMPQKGTDCVRAFGPFNGPSDPSGTKKLNDIRGADGNRSRAKCETRGDSRRLASTRELVAFGPNELTVEDALASAIEGAVSAGRWDVVAQLAKELEARRLAAVGVMLQPDEPAKRSPPM